MDNRTPLLLDAAQKALMVIADVGLERSPNGLRPESIVHLMNMREHTGKTVDERLEEAHGLLKEALLLHSKEIGLED